MAASFAATQRQGAVARQRLNERTTPASNAQDSRETETMRSTLPAQFDGFNAQKANASLLSFLQASALQRAREEPEVQRLSERHTREVNACDAPDVACATAADRAHNMRLSSFKDPIYQRGVSAWNSLRSEIKRLENPIMRGVKLLAADGRWLLGRTGDKQGKPLASFCRDDGRRQSRLHRRCTPAQTFGMRPAATQPPHALVPHPHAPAQSAPQ